MAADRTRMNSQLLAAALARDGQLAVIEAEPTAEAIVAATCAEKPDVLLLSSELEDNPTLGFQVARQLRTAHPKTQIVMLLDASERGSVLEAFRAGVRGVYCRTESLKSLSKCIHCAHSGQVWANSRELGFLVDAVSEVLPMRLSDASGSSLLSKREQDVVRCVVEGLSNREIARRLTLTEHTVKNYLFRIFDKLGVSSRVEVVLYAFSLQSSGPSSSAAAHARHASHAKQSRATSKLSAK